MRRIPVLLFLSGCTVFPSPDATPPAVFEAIWTDFDEHFGGFRTKPEVDWSASYEALAPTIDETTPDEELAATIRALLLPLNDDHVYFHEFAGEDVWTSYTPPRPESEVDLDVVRSLLSGVETPNDAVFWGRLEGNVGYLRIEHFDRFGLGRTLRDLVDDLDDTEGLIVDIRDTPGGTDAVAMEIAACFTETPNPFLNVRVKTGPGRDDFSDPILHTVEPDPSCRWDRPTVLLTDAFTVSAGEVFTLAMVDLPQVTHAGEHTTGSMSDVVGRDLPNGWVYGVSIGEWRDENDVSWEGRGIPPTLEVVNTAEARQAGRDLALEVASEHLLGL